MIDLYKHDNLNYKNNGDMTLTPISCKLKQVLNGENYIELEHPFDKEGRWQYLLYDNVIAVPTPTSKKQLYRIYNHVKNDDSVTVYARHIFFDLVDKVLLAVRPSLVNGQTCLDMILKDTNFKGHSNIATNNVILDLDGKNVINALCSGDEESFLKKYGGEILLDNFDITLNNKIGNDNEVQALFGFNLESIEEDINIEEVHTRLIPEMSDGTRLTGNTPWIDSKYINKYANIKETIVKFDDIKIKEKPEDEEGFATRQEAEAEMVRRCNVLFANGVDVPKVNYKVNIVDLSNTIDYKNYKQLLTINLGDTVTCKHRMLDIDVKARCISFTFDCLTEKYEEIELGQFISNYLDMQNEVNADLRKKIEMNEQKITLEVSNISKTLTSKIEMTEDAIRAEAEDTKKGLISKIELTAKGLTEDYTNKTDDLHTEITKTAKGLESKVSKGEDFGTELEQNAKSVLIAIKDETDMNVIFDHNGQTIKNGALIVKDSKNKTIMRFNQDGSAGVKGLYIEDVEKGSQFYTTLLNMPHLDCQHLHPEKLVIDHRKFYIDDGYDLKEYIKKIISES